MSYDRLADYYTKRRGTRQTRYRSVVPGWDNTPRREERATIFAGASPSRYFEWLEHARDCEAQRAGGGLVFINAWNEWGEGAYLEPDDRFGDAYLRATAGEPPVEEILGEAETGLSLPPVAELRSLLRAVAGSVLAGARKVRNLWR